MATKKNRNYSYIAKETVEQKLGTLDYCPVVGYLYKNDKGEYRIAGHEAHFDDDWELVPDTQAFGVVKPNSYHWETINEFGTEVDYLVADIILWVGRFKGLFDARYSDEVYFSQSMEISVNEYRPLDEDSNYVEILDFSFSALCLLGKYDNPDENVTPCFINAKVEPKFSVSEFASQIEEIKNKLFALNEEEGETMDNNENMTMELETEEVVESEAEIVEETTEEVAEVDETTEEETTEEEVTVDYEAKYNDALSEIETLKAQVAELTQSVETLTPYKLAAEKAERENAENDVFAKYDSRIGEMAEYAELKTKAGEYSIADLERECLILVGKFAMTETKTEEVEPETEPTITFALDETVETKPSRYSDIYETYKSR
jgi:outer membrane murein-binding lipoprotein Lpp